MKQKNHNTKKGCYKHLNQQDRYRIEAMLEQKMKIFDIAQKIGCHKSTIYREIRRGIVMRLQSDLTEKPTYRANFAHNDYINKARDKGVDLKIGNDHKLVEYIKNKLINEKYSPDAVIGQIKKDDLTFKNLISTKTLYSYIDRGLFPEISNKNLWRKKNKRRRKYRCLSRVSLKNKQARSIEKRSDKINNRSEFGHWEGDTVKSPKEKTTSLLTLTERLTRSEIIFKLDYANQNCVQQALDLLERKYKDLFPKIFKSITLDNGSEFLDWKNLEQSVLDNSKQRTTIYFAHPYSSWERGTNENHNGIIRRFIPKGTDLADVTDKEIENIQDWMNNYPRKILGYSSPSQIMNQCLLNIS